MTHEYFNNLLKKEGENNDEIAIQTWQIGHYKKDLKVFYVIELIFTGGQSKQITESIKFVK